MLSHPVGVRWLVGALCVAALGCGPGSSTVGGGQILGNDGGGGSGGTGGSGGSGGSGGAGGGGAAACPDDDGDGYTTCAGDCNDSDPAIHPGATEVLNSKDDDCDGKVDNHIAGRDYDQDGTPYPQDCNDDNPLVGPNAIEVVTDGGDGVDNNCNGLIDEAPPGPCDPSASATSAADFAKAIGMCPLANGTAVVTAASFAAGDATARDIRPKFGSYWTPKQGSQMVLLSSGLALDNLDDPTYSPGIFNTSHEGWDFGTTDTHPLYSAPKCGGAAGTPSAHDMTEFKVSLKVPQNANSLSFQFNFFSAEYPEYVCTRYNDRFIAILESKALDQTKLPNGGVGQCVTGAATPTCNISFDSTGQPVTINNGYFDVCVPASGSGPPPWSNACAKPVSMLAGTGYEKPDSSCSGCIVGGATGWLTTKAPVVPGETITLRFIVFDEGDWILDSAVLIDNFKWDATAVAAPVTDPGIN